MTHDMYLILEKKVKACEDFLSATLLIKDALGTEEMAEADHLIGHRQELIRVIDEMNQRIEYSWHSDPLEKNQRVVRYSEDLKRLLTQIITANHDCEVIAAGRCADFKKELMNIRLKREVVHGYSHSQENTQKFLDIQT